MAELYQPGLTHPPSPNFAADCPCLDLGSRGCCWANGPQAETFFAAPPTVIYCLANPPDNLESFPGRTAADLAWGNPAVTDPAQDWQIQWSTEPAFGSYSEHLKTNTGTHLQGITGLTSGVHYYWRIRARDSDDCYSAWATAEFDTF